MTQISEIMQNFPERKFILVGDSGEKDPEVYREIKKKFSSQVQEIMIRDIHKFRLDGMTIIDAVTGETVSKL